MTIKDDLSKYPCYFYQLGTIRPIPEITFLLNESKKKEVLNEKRTYNEWGYSKISSFYTS